ncbi:MAG TPA: hypothetical protein DEP18_07415 [Flavobacteriales bacterium]|nr:hypothetical protein [Flavobacteriales bacterium]HCA83602.1 hypothetical protein [Flavobacteriales bacterium]HRE73318.1 hypothetical protein [Flavobacteriales bacterium]HRE98167.1 hypothetical protein [Flavobacteriales bacterium]HRJ35638.1 hypothetical protein [Flavobacteriales bacterium]
MENTSPSANDLILKSLKEKSSVKQDVFYLSKARFSEFKKILAEFANLVSKEASKIDERLKVVFTDKGEYEAQLQVAGDVLVFHLHTNVFLFDSDHSLWKTSYLKDDASRGYCGIIHVYNFLSDSFKYNRLGDLGYLVARVFVNRENHFMVQGKRQLGFLYNDFINSQFSPEQMKAVVESIVLYTIDFDLFTPPYDLIKEVSLMEIKELSDTLQMKTGKRLGFKFQADSDDF